MYNVNITNARNDLYNLVDMVINDSEMVNIATKNGNAVIISEADYNSLLETLYLSSDPEYKKSLLESAKAPLSDFADESELNW
ncbi:MAG: type II toxin-antitoxin system Phd/YefM family antitoxin [Acutalibacteraceae bacterium]